MPYTTTSSIRFAYAVQSRGSPTSIGVRVVKIDKILKGRKVTQYLVKDINNRLGAVSLKASDLFNRFPTQENCLDERGNLILGDCTTDQSLQGLFTRVAAWFRGHLYDISIGLSVIYIVSMLPLGDLLTENTNVVWVKRKVSWSDVQGRKDNTPRRRKTACLWTAARPCHFHRPRGHRMGHGPPGMVLNL